MNQPREKQSNNYNPEFEEERIFREITYFNKKDNDSYYSGFPSTAGFKFRNNQEIPEPKLSYDVEEVMCATSEMMTRLAIAKSTPAIEHDFHRDRKIDDLNEAHELIRCHLYKASKTGYREALIRVASVFRDLSKDVDRTTLIDYFDKAAIHITGIRQAIKHLKKENCEFMEANSGLETLLSLFMYDSKLLEGLLMDKNKLDLSPLPRNAGLSHDIREVVEKFVNIQLRQSQYSQPETIYFINPGRLRDMVDQQISTSSGYNIGIKPCAPDFCEYLKEADREVREDYEELEARDGAYAIIDVDSLIFKIEGEYVKNALTAFCHGAMGETGKINEAEISIFAGDLSGRIALQMKEVNGIKIGTLHLYTTEDLMAYLSEDTEIDKLAINYNTGSEISHFANACSKLSVKELEVTSFTRTSTALAATLGRRFINNDEAFANLEKLKVIEGELSVSEINEQNLNAIIRPQLKYSNCTYEIAHSPADRPEAKKVITFSRNKKEVS